MVHETFVQTGASYCYRIAVERRSDVGLDSSKGTADQHKTLTDLDVEFGVLKTLARTLILRWYVSCMILLMKADSLKLSYYLSLFMFVLYASHKVESFLLKTWILRWWFWLPYGELFWRRMCSWICIDYVLLCNVWITLYVTIFTESLLITSNEEVMRDNKL